MVGRPSRVLVVAGISIAAAAIIIFAGRSPFSTFELENPTTLASNNAQSESFFTIQMCSGGGLPSGNAVNAEGFVMPYAQPEISQYVLEPESTGYITMEYDFCANSTGTLGPNPSYTLLNSTELQELLDSYNSTNRGISKFNPEAVMSDPNIERYGPLGGMASPPVHIPSTISIPGAEGTGVTISSGELIRLNEHTAQITYVLAAEPAAEQASYVFSFYRICPGMILTIGNEPSNEPVVQKWADGPFYGCVG